MRGMVLFVLAVVGMSFAGSVENCMLITGPGVYTAGTDYNGAYYDTGAGAMACIVVDSSDVIVDCAGHSVTGYGDTYGVYINNTASNSLDNVTVRNCNISNYQYGIYSWGSYPEVMEGCNFSNNTLYNTYEDLMLVLAEDCAIDGNRFARSVSLHSLNDSSITNNVMEPVDFCYGMYLNAIMSNEPIFNTNDVIYNNTVSGCYDTGFDISSIVASNISFNDANGNWYSGFSIYDGYNNTLYNNAARNNSLSDIYTAGFELGGEGNLLDHNIAENNSNGFDLFASNNILRDNHAFHNYLGMTLESKSAGNIVENNTFDENVYVDMIVAGDARALQFNSIGCANTIRNNTGSGGRPIYYSNQSGTAMSGGTYSEVILCGAGQSNLTGVTVAGSDTLANNGFMILFSPDSTLRGLVSEDNAIGLWLYGCNNCTVAEGHASGNAVGYLVTYTGNATVSDLSSSGNNASLTDLFGKGSMMGFLSSLLSGGGVLEMMQVPVSAPSAENQVQKPNPIVGFYSNNVYRNIEAYDNAYGFSLVGTGNVTLQGVDVHDNANWGVADMGGNSGFPVAVISSDSQLYRNGRNILNILLGMGASTQQANSPESEIGPFTSQTNPAPEIPEGILWGEYLQASMLYQMMIGGSYANPAIWSMDDVRHGTGSPSVLLSALDGAESMYLTSETDLPARSSFEYTRDNKNVRVNMNITGPQSNKTPVNSEYFSIIAMGQAGELCSTYCDPWGCTGQVPGCYFYDDLGYCMMCSDKNQNSICDDFECIDADPQDGLCDSGCSDVDGNGMCDTCDPVLPAIDNFVATPGGSIGGYNRSSLELYYLNITDIYQPGQTSSIIIIPPQNKTFNVEGEWLPVPGQSLVNGSVTVDSLEIPESQVLGGLLDLDPDAGLYQGIYGLFATAAPSTDDDTPTEPRPQEPEQNQTPPECSADSDCAVNEQCTDGQCVRIICDCGEVKSHECVEYECCSDSQCGSGETCQNHACKAEEPKFECASDAQCAATSFCNIASGAAGGACEPVEVQPCGVVRDHKFVAYGYECGTEPGCPSCPQGESCSAHKCIQTDVSCPTTGIVGDKKTCEAKQDGMACPNCDYVVTAPDGRTFGGKTDESGNFELPLDIKGTYQVALLKDGQPVRIIQVQAFPQAQPEDTGKPAAAGPDMSTLLWVLVLFVLLVGGILYWRSMGQGPKKKSK